MVGPLADSEITSYAVNKLHVDFPSEQSKNSVSNSCAHLVNFPVSLTPSGHDNCAKFPVKKKKKSEYINPRANMESQTALYVISINV